VAHESGGPSKDIIDHGFDGFLARDIDEYVDIIRFVLFNDHVAEYIGLNARKESQKFGSENFCGQFISLFKKVLMDTNLSQ